MSSVPPINYEEILDKVLQQIDEYHRLRNYIDDELSKLVQFVHATTKLLPGDARIRFLDKWGPSIVQSEKLNASLADATRKALISSYRVWQTVANVRTALEKDGFDFSGYTSNALSSVSTTLRRLKDAGEAEADEIEGVTVYRATLKLRKTFKARQPASQFKRGDLAKAFAKSIEGLSGKPTGPLAGLGEPTDEKPKK